MTEYIIPKREEVTEEVVSSNEVIGAVKMPNNFSPSYNPTQSVPTIQNSENNSMPVILEAKIPFGEEVIETPVEPSVPVDPSQSNQIDKI